MIFFLLMQAALLVRTRECKQSAKMFDIVYVQTKWITSCLIDRSTDYFIV